MYISRYLHRARCGLWLVLAPQRRRGGHRDQDTSEGRADSHTGNTDTGAGADTHTELFISYFVLHCLLLKVGWISSSSKQNSICASENLLRFKLSFGTNWDFSPLIVLYLEPQFYGSILLCLQDRQWSVVALHPIQHLLAHISESGLLYCTDCSRTANKLAHLTDSKKKCQKA